MKQGFTLIELIVAIIVIGIAMMSVPLLLSQSSRSNEFSLDQEAILAASTKIGNILSYPWDDKLVSEVDVKHILDVTHGDSELNRSPDNNSTRRIGNFKANYRRKFNTNLTYASVVLGKTGDTNTTAYNDMDDFNGTSDIINGSGSGDYLMDLNLTTQVFYISDNAAYSSSPTLNFGDLNISAVTPTTNLKMVQVKVVNLTNNQDITTLRAFSANIGSYELLYRTFN